ncbi:MULTISPECIES: DUF882 domain-containing protein [unclassified Nitrosomonas]|uniref:YcbK family protein n=1 Tax=unclassified Nitrosomonas TaxID=2609265 RepID=UPI00089B39AB|nr:MULTISPECIES: DUF882 domain-containing protein [unclassified Nitrosomonas]MDV6343852.1 DUF882 domain-containing protein [Nitrosomonas sp. Is37]SDY10575.1 Uncharacterized conserved protein YcbK, DUF882 family [Nitrosomonas sp. Nm33]
MFLQGANNDNNQLTELDVSRRFFIKTGLSACTLLALPAAAYASKPKTTVKQLALLNLHTGERVKSVYWEKGRYISSSLRDIEKILRDHRTGKTHIIDLRLLDILQFLYSRMGARKEFQVISGYRSPETNKMLALQNHGVAKQSLHMQGRAIDIRLPEFSLADLRKAALSLKVGGVGYYPNSNFIHLDTGNVRYW